MKEGGSMADNFDNSWKEALDKIELTPDPSVWEAVDHHLANSDVGYYRKKAQIYKWAAIAAVVFAISISIPGYLNKQKGPINNSQNNSVLSTGQIVSNEEDLFFDINIPMTRIKGIGLDRNSILLADREDKHPVGANHQLALKEMRDSFTLKSAVVSTERGIGQRNAPDVRVYHKPNYALLATNTRQDQNESNKFWAGVGVGSSTFDPNYQLNQPNNVVGAVLRSQPNFVSSTQEVKGQETTFRDQLTEGINYQVGMNLGVRMGKRLSLESGFTYAEAQLTSHTDLIIENKIFAKSIAMTSEVASLNQVSQVTSTQDIVEYNREEISLDNTFQFASIPLKAGYLLVDKKIQIQFNAGVITNIYMGNTLTDHTDQVASLELFPGNSSPYRTVSFSGITGVSLGYNFFDQFDLMVEPNFSQALQPLTKDESNFNATPSGFGMMAGLRYRFGY